MSAPHLGPIRPDYIPADMPEPEPLFAPGTKLGRPAPARMPRAWFAEDRRPRSDGFYGIALIGELREMGGAE